MPGMGVQIEKGIRIKGILRINYPGAEPRSIKWNLLFPTQRVGVLYRFDKSNTELNKP